MSIDQEYNKLAGIFNGVELSDDEKRYLFWLSRWDYETIGNFYNMFYKLKNYNEKNKETQK